MKIATKTGDDGTTSLLYGGRVQKSDFRIEIVGVMDELSAHLGLSKLEAFDFLSKKSLYLSAEDCPTAYDIAGYLEDCQRILITIMGEIVCENDRYDRYSKNFPIFDIQKLNELDRRVESLESDPSFVPKDWIVYGHNRISAHLDLSSKVCRRAERTVWKYVLSERLNNTELITKYLNRLSDYLYLSSRFFEKNWV
jgi:cob(I)alamin adenosyltransferase